MLTSVVFLKKPVGNVLIVYAKNCLDKSVDLYFCYNL